MTLRDGNFPGPDGLYVRSALVGRRATQRVGGGRLLFAIYAIRRWDLEFNVAGARGARHPLGKPGDVARRHLCASLAAGGALDARGFYQIVVIGVMPILMYGQRRMRAARLVRADLGLRTDVLMISHEHRCIFVHIPKTGGTSIEDVIWPGARTEAELWMGLVDPMQNRYQTGGLQHLLARHIRTAAGPETFGAYFKFSVVRNPWDRVISQYAFMRHRPDLCSHIGLEDDAPLSEYLARIGDIEHVQWMPQCAFIQDSSGADMIDFVGRFETLEEDMQHLFARLGIDCARLPHVNASDRRRNYRGYYNARTRATVARMYAADIELFGYGF